jgi:hypothetical protein
VTRAVVVRYRVRPDAVDENVRLVRAVYEELAATRPAGLRYSTVQLDETTFVHLGVLDGESNPLDAVAAFGAFTAGIAQRCDQAPVVTAGQLIGRYP